MSVFKILDQLNERIAQIDEELEKAEATIAKLNQEKKSIKDRVDLAMEVVAELQKDFQENYNNLCLSAIDSGSAGIDAIKTFGESSGLKYEFEEKEKSPPDVAA